MIDTGIIPVINEKIAVIITAVLNKIRRGGVLLTCQVVVSDKTVKNRDTKRAKHVRDPVTYYF